jgi:hypothetical protein
MGIFGMHMYIPYGNSGPDQLRVHRGGLGVKFLGWGFFVFLKLKFGREAIYIWALKTGLKKFIKFYNINMKSAKKIPTQPDLVATRLQLLFCFKTSRPADGEILVRAMFENSAVKVVSLIFLFASSVISLPLFYLIRDYERDQPNR